MNKWLIGILVISLLIVGCSTTNTTTAPESAPAALETVPASNTPQTPAQKEETSPTASQTNTAPADTPAAKPTESALPKVSVSAVAPLYEFEADLKDWPKMFLGKDDEGNKVFNGVIIIGAKAPLKDIIAGQNIAYGINNGIKRPGYFPQTVIDSQIENVKAVNAVVIGCENAATKALIGSCDVQSGKAKIKLLSNNGKTQMVVIGSTADDTIRASEMLRDYMEKSLSGTEMTV